MAISLEAFLYAITSNETGHTKNPYSAVGPPTKDGNRAYGKYQIMDFNIPVWSKQYLGRRISLSEYRNSPDIQEQLARAVLTDYYKKYGAEGAAAMWFSGEANPNSNASDGHWTVRQYVSEMKKAAAKYTGGGGGGSYMPWDRAKSGGGGGTTTPTIDPATLASDYGFTAAMLNSIPELKSIFQRAVAGGWDGKRFQSAIENSTWWKTHTKSQREYLTKNFTDPAQFQRDRTAMNYKINEIAAQLGLTDLMGTKIMNDLTWNMLYNGWSDAELKYHLANVLTMSPEGVLGGAGGQFQMQMASLGWANGVRLDQNWYLGWYKQILQGNATAEEAQAWIRNRAAATFPAFRDQILAGQNVMDLANPYIQSMGNILEINAGDIDLFDKDVIGALNYKDPKTGATGAKPLWQWEVDLRKDPRWLQTNNAREGMMGVAHKVAQDMGVLF